MPGNEPSTRLLTAVLRALRPFGSGRRRLRRALGRGEIVVLGQRLVVPRGQPHPLDDDSAEFFHRSVGMMIAPGHRVLDLGTGLGLGAMIAASRGAEVVAVDVRADALDAARTNLAAAGLLDRVELRQGRAEDVVGEGAFDLVLYNPPRLPKPVRGPEDLATRAGAGWSEVGAVLSASPRWIGEKGRLLILADGGRFSAFVASAVPPGYRVVPLARSLGLLPGMEVLSLGFDLEAARLDRHAARERKPEQRAERGRRRWKALDGDEPAEVPEAHP